MHVCAGVLMLLIFDAMALVFFRAFSVPMRTDSTFDAYPEGSMSFCAYFCAIFKFWDVMGLIGYNKTDAPQSAVAIA